MRRMQNYEVSLPEGYEASFVIDAASRKTSMGLSQILCKHCRAVQNRAKII